MLPRLRRALAVWCGLSAAGVVLLLLPDPDARVLSLSSTHGLAPLDVAGAALLVAGWAVHLVALLTVRRRIRFPGALLAAFAAGLAVVAWSVSGDVGAWYLPGALLAVAAQVAAGVTARPPDTPQI